MPPARKAPVPVPRSTLERPGATDLSLSTLICSVERDIQLLEQMERSGSALGHLPSLPSLPSSPSPTPPLSSTLLSLPGYRPRPPVPSSPSVVNPGYDALLCRRLYPVPPSTPPPPLPAKAAKGHRRRNSDSLLSSSLASTPRRSSPPPGDPATPESPGEAVMAERVTRHAAAPRQVFCPFCPGHFYQQEHLQDHLVSQHSPELQALRREELHQFHPETCPCCQAQFLQVGLGARHLVHHHPEFVCALLLGSLPPPSGRPPVPPGAVPSTPPPDRHAFCLLCGQRFLRKHVKLLALHLQQQHPQQFGQAVAAHCSMTAVVESPAVVATPCSPPHHYEEVDGSPGPSYLHLLPDARPVDHDSKRQRREEREEGREEGRGRVARRLHTPQWSQHSRSFKRAGPRVVGETYQGIAQPEPPANPITGMGSESHLLEEDHSPSFKVMEKENYLHYSSAHLLFRCNLCGDRFAVNDLLLSHLKNDHMAVSRVLKPQYSCAKCPANFFKNAFLLKHSLIHTQSKPAI